MRIVKFYLSLALAFSLAVPTLAQKTLKNIIDKGEIRVGMTGDQPPFCMKTNAGYIGYEADLAQALADVMNVELTIIQMSFDELLPALEKGDVHAVMSGMTITPERSVKAMFAGPYTLSGKSILTKSNVISRAENTDDVNKKKYEIVAMKGTNSTDFVKKYMPNAVLVEVENYEVGIDLVLTDSVDAMVADYPVCIMAALEYEAEDIVTLNQPLSIEPIGMALPAGDVQFANLINNYITTMRISGTLDMLESAWFGDGSWMNALKN